jgi:hypothetical protein
MYWIYFFSARKKSCPRIVFSTFVRSLELSRLDIGQTSLYYVEPVLCTLKAVRVAGGGEGDGWGRWGVKAPDCFSPQIKPNSLVSVDTENGLGGLAPPPPTHRPFNPPSPVPLPPPQHLTKGRTVSRLEESGGLRMRPGNSSHFNFTRNPFRHY